MKIVGQSYHPRRIFNPNKKNDTFFEPRLSINKPNDVYEQEADAMAEKVMRMSSNENHFFTPANASTSIQKKCAHCEEEEKLQMKGEGNASGGMTAPSIVHDVINSGGQPLDANARNFFEPKFGHDFSNVKIHNDSLAHQSSNDINARAYTHGQHIVFGNGQYQPNTNSGKQLLAHELTHVLQQGITGLNSVQREPSSSETEKKENNLSIGQRIRHFFNRVEPEELLKEVKEGFEKAHYACAAASYIFPNSEGQKFLREASEKFETASKSIGKVLKLASTARAIFNFLVAVNEVRKIDVSKDPQKAAKAFGELFSTAGKLGKALGDPTGYADFISNAGNFFENVRGNLDPETRYGRRSESKDLEKEGVKMGK